MTDIDIHSLDGHSHNPLASFCYYPDHVDFIEKDPDEKIVLLIRRHPITNIPWMIASILMLFAPIVIVNLPFLNFLPERFLIITIIFWYILTLAFAFEKFLNWFFNVNIITDQRMFDVDFVNLIYRKITDADLDKIQDVTVKVGSVVRTVFNYGDILIQTAAEISEVEFEGVPQPDRIAKIIRELRVSEEEEVKKSGV